MSRLGTVGLSAFVLAVLVGRVQADERDEASSRARAMMRVVEAPIEVANPDEAQGRAKIMKALDEPTKFEFNELSLQDVVLYLKDRHHIEIQIDKKTLEEASIGVDTPATRNLEGVSLRSALRLMLGALDLTYVIKDEVLLITTPAAADVETIVRIYPVGDLITPNSTDKHGHEFAALVEVIKGTVGPNTWQGPKGVGSIEPWALGQALVIRQTSAGHEEIEPLLAGLRRSRAVESQRISNKAIVDRWEQVARERTERRGGQQ